MDIEVHSDSALTFAGRTVRCALGRGGVRADKREGDGATPAGCFALRRVLYRADRVARPDTVLPAGEIGRADGWCDDPEDADYNRPVTLPHAARAETMWRDDRLYDIVVVLGHNDDPPVPGAGSAIFLHVAHPEYRPTEGCVALALSDLRDLLSACDGDDRIRISAPGAVRR